MKKAPLHVITKTPFGPAGPKFRLWQCDERLQAAELQYRRDGRLRAIVHRSTKEPGKWQTSYFDDSGPTGDIQSASCQLAVRELPPRHWRLRNVSPKR